MKFLSGNTCCFGDLGGTDSSASLNFIFSGSVHSSQFRYSADKKYTHLWNLSHLGKISTQLTTSGIRGITRKMNFQKKGTCLINRIKRIACPHRGVPGVTRWVRSTPTPVFFPHQLNSSLQWWCHRSSDPTWILPAAFTAEQRAAFNEAKRSSPLRRWGCGLYWQWFFIWIPGSLQ